MAVKHVPVSQITRELVAAGLRLATAATDPQDWYALVLACRGRDGGPGVTRA